MNNLYNITSRTAEHFPELADAIELSGAFQQFGSVSILGEVNVKSGVQLPILSFSIGKGKKNTAVLFTAGIHGLERIGSRVVLAFMKSIINRMTWDATLEDMLGGVQLYFLPILNPGGIFNHSRSNPQGIDLMRNAPLSAEEPPPFFIGGHRFSKFLPYYRGKSEKDIGYENTLLFQFVNGIVQKHSSIISIDCHSGYGGVDRLWFPYAGRKRPLENLSEMVSLYSIFESTYPNHFYKVEPQSASYTTHGDVWDWLYLENLGKNNLFLPLTLEMSSWIWIRKNWKQLASKSGIFNPSAPHREKRVLRRHFTLFDFLIRAAYSIENWIPGKKKKILMREKGLELWYR